MIIDYDTSFQKDIKKLKDKSLSVKLKLKLLEFKEATELSDLTNIKKLKGHNHYYRLKIGHYRLGFSYDGELVRFIHFMHRKDIYRYFP